MHIIIYVYFPIINIPSKRIQKRPSVAPGDGGSHPLLQWKHTAEGVLGLEDPIISRGFREWWVFE